MHILTTYLKHPKLTYRFLERMLFKKCFRLVQNRAIRESVNAKCTSHFGVHLYFFCHFLEKKSKNISVTKKPESSYIFTFYDGLRSVFHGILYNFFYFGDNVSSVNVCYFNFERKTKLRLYIHFLQIFLLFAFLPFYLLDHT